MQFAPQQLNGGPKYSASTRIGNWYEEIAIEEAKLNDFKQKSQNGNSKLRNLQSKISKCTQKVAFISLSFVMCITFE